MWPYNEVRYKRQNEGNIVLQCNNHYYRHFWHLLISTINSHFFSSSGFWCKATQRSASKSWWSPRVTLRPQIVRSLVDVIMGYLKLPVPVIQICWDRVGANGLAQTRQTFWLKSYKGLKEGYFSIFLQFFAIFGQMIKQNSVTVPIQVMKSAGNLVGILMELPKTFQSYISKARRFFRPVSNPKIRNTAKRARDRSECLP